MRGSVRYGMFMLFTGIAHHCSTSPALHDIPRIFKCCRGQVFRANFRAGKFLPFFFVLFWKTAAGDKGRNQPIETTMPASTAFRNREQWRQENRSFTSLVAHAWVNFSSCFSGLHTSSRDFLAFSFSRVKRRMQTAFLPSIKAVYYTWTIRRNLGTPKYFRDCTFSKLSATSESVHRRRRLRHTTLTQGCTDVPWCSSDSRPHVRLDVGQTLFHLKTARCICCTPPVCATERKFGTRAQHHSRRSSLQQSATRCLFRIITACCDWCRDCCSTHVPW